MQVNWDQADGTHYMLWWLMSRSVVWFSCGAASAIAAKYAVKKYENCEVVYCDTGGEHQSNGQFLKDVEKWIGGGLLS